MVKFIGKLLLILCTIFLFTNSNSICYANSAEPPSILIIVPNAPDDLKINIKSEDYLSKSRIIDKTIEKQFLFYSAELRQMDEYILIINSSEYNFELSIEKPINKYNNIFTLSLKDEKLVEGKAITRSIKLVSLRILLTLLIEGLIFYLFKFREKRSWLAFICINLVTQGGLNIWINGFSPAASYMILALLFVEIIIILIEFIAFLSIVKERSKLVKIFHVFIANIFSLALGGYIISALPI